MLRESRSKLWNTEMPTGPEGEKRPADEIGNAVHIGKIAMGTEDTAPSLRARARTLKPSACARRAQLGLRL